MPNEPSSEFQAETQALSAWRPIETAPIGTEVIVYVPRRVGIIYVGAINYTGKQWWARNLGAVRPTHWMPIPEPPK